ncbi:hypothetical protein ACTXPS_18325 [Brachybacterium tyrofermentans]|uniref:hypothetical protein n=1 Tax=Brachybacterium tyrofermentans TaxID=47848 RepID=UPI003FD66C10
MRIDDFFKDVPDPGNPWGAAQVELDSDLLLQLVKGTVSDGNSLETRNDQNLWMVLGGVTCKGRTFPRMIF